MAHRRGPRARQFIQVRATPGRGLPPWICARVRAIVSHGFLYDGQYGSTFMERDSRSWRRVRKGIC
jgi:hypothetical protein